MGPAIAASLHYLSIFLLFALLTGEHLLFKPQMDVARARSLMRIDLAYGVTAGLVLATGALRLWVEKGLDYYLHNAVFHAKVGLFLLIGLISALPTLTFFNWRNDVLAGRVPVLSATRYRQTLWAIRLELLLLICLPVLASFMARGFGMIGFE